MSLSDGGRFRIAEWRDSVSGAKKLTTNLLSLNGAGVVVTRHFPVIVAHLKSNHTHNFSTRHLLGCDVSRVTIAPKGDSVVITKPQITNLFSPNGL